MWFFSKKKTVADSRLLDGFVDWHSHILPGVDDGVEETEESFRILELMYSVGTRHVVLTPHIMEDIPNETADLLNRFNKLISECQDGNMPKMSLGAENMLDNLFLKRQECTDFLPIKADRLLVETSYFNPPMDLDGMLSSIASSGYFPVLAHPERYRYMSQTDYTRLKSAGVLFQLNLTSVVGGYGREAYDKSHMLLEMGYYDMAGLDIHRYSQYDNFLKVEIPDKLVRQLRPLLDKSNMQL
ncbi:MAG: capsular biosynthesis protein [Muribaculum sp.]|nr:capsular biosynthesis protein [Muribaculum sp.]